MSYLCTNSELEIIGDTDSFAFSKARSSKALNQVGGAFKCPVPAYLARNTVYKICLKNGVSCEPSTQVLLCVDSPCFVCVMK